MSNPTTSEPDAGSAATAAQAAREGAVPTVAPTDPGATLKLETLRLAQQAGAQDDPGHPAKPDEVVARANTYWEWMQK